MTEDEILIKLNEIIEPIWEHSEQLRAIAHWINKSKQVIFLSELYDEKIFSPFHRAEDVKIGMTVIKVNANKRHRFIVIRISDTDKDFFVLINKCNGEQLLHNTHFSQISLENDN